MSFSKQSFRQFFMTSKAYLFLAIGLLANAAALAILFVFRVFANEGVATAKKEPTFILAFAIIFYSMGITVWGLYKQRKTDDRLRGLANYVERLRCFTVKKADSIESRIELLNDGKNECDPEPPPTVVPTEPTIEKPLLTRERDTLLTIIAALAKEAKLQIDQPGKTALYIEGLTNEMGSPVSKRAIEEHLKKIPNALETRMK
ncbi:hypothetical protein [Rhodoferax sp.]|uniref:hypothetical protein n=1 Tax=Rhodoferax sp. TaxID=50421 RepID=UPI0026167E1C|nr:hypothetical protein [Rhodoferax sp.]MDD2809282.1 hypothetical protein [Rhodoferax sp.]